ncbi:hypothetical protein Q427_18075 [Halomonas sp. BC04]|nr:hypothetical protein Q427_18075 [Halomonas sp. BC04]
MARQAAMLCQDPVFRLYLDRRRRYKHGLTNGQLPDGTHNQQDARDWLIAACRIKSRADLDHDEQAEKTFRQIRHRFNAWRAKNKGNP